MGDPGLVDFPLPILTALLCGLLAVLVWRLDLGVTRASMAFSALFVLCMIQALLVAMRFGYGVVALIPLQRTLPLMLGPMIYFSFMAMRLGTRDLARSAALHFGMPVIAVVLFWLRIGDMRYLDWLIMASYLFYMAALFRLWRMGPDALIYARVDATGSVSTWILRSIGLLGFILVLDTAISVDFALSGGVNAPALISYGTAPLIIVLLALIMAFPAMLTRSRRVARPAPTSSTEDAEVEMRLRTLMEKEVLFLDPDLTVQRLARRLHLAARDVSGAVNRTQNANVSQYVNDFRLTHAAKLLVESNESVGRIAEKSGFMARSNFYREFQRVFGQSPTEYRTERRRSNGAAG